MKDDPRSWATVSGLCQVAAFFHALHAPKPETQKISKAFRAKKTDWKKRR